MYKSTDAGAHWGLLYPPEHELNEYRALAIHPTQPNILIAGGPWDAWRSTDAGATWEILDFDLSYIYGIEDVDFAAGDPNIVYSATQSNIYGKAVFKSTDAGATWTDTHNDLARVGTTRDIEVDPTNSQVVYLASWNYDSLEVGHFLAKTTDGGGHWFDISPEVFSGWGAMQVLVNPANPLEVWVCTVFDGVKKSTDGGLTWSSFNDSLRTLEMATIQCDPTGANIYLGVFYDGIYRFIPISRSWRQIGQDIHLSDCKALAVNFHNAAELLTAANNGPFLSPDYGETWRLVETGIPITESPGEVSYDRYLASLRYLATWSRSAAPPPMGFYVSTDFGTTWESRISNLPSDVHFADMAISYSDSAGRRVFLATGRGLFFTDDFGDTWAEAVNGLPPGNAYSTIEVSSFDESIIALGDWQNRIFISADRGEHWVQTAPLPPRWIDEYISDLAFDPYDFQRFYAVSWPCSLYATDNGGQDWRDISNDLPRSPAPLFDRLFISSILVNTLDPQNMYALVGKYGAYQSHNGGGHWESFSIGLPASAASGEISFSLADTTRLYIASSGRSVWSIHRTLTDVEDDNPNLPQSISLSAYPNPFNARTTFTFGLPTPADVSLTIYDIQGRRVAILLDDAPRPAGAHAVVWDAMEISSGLYFARLRARDIERTLKMTLLK
jgi:photosystem II stability/assembly factor-like uncharacterized protein